MAWWGVIALVAATVLGVTGGVADARPPARPGSSMGALLGRQQAQRLLAVRVVAIGCSGTSVGSGVIVPDGRVITNRHVVAGAVYVEVQRSDGRRIGAAIERVGADIDLATLWAGPAVGTGVVPGGRLDPGGSVQVLGHPLGGALVASAGRITARATYDNPGMRSPAAYIDALVAAGNSGGPAFDGAGRLVGVVFGIENNTKLAAAMDGDTVARFLAGEGRSGDPQACEPEVE